MFVFGLFVGWLTAAPVVILALALGDAAARGDQMMHPDDK